MTTPIFMYAYTVSPGKDIPHSLDDRDYPPLPEKVTCGGTMAL
jgi:hypothetical protein